MGQLYFIRETFIFAMVSTSQYHFSFVSEFSSNPWYIRTIIQLRLSFVCLSEIHICHSSTQSLSVQVFDQKKFCGRRNLPWKTTVISVLKKPSENQQLGPKSELTQQMAQVLLEVNKHMWKLLCWVTWVAKIESHYAWQRRHPVKIDLCIN